MELVTIELVGSRITLALEGPGLQAVASRAGVRTIARIISEEMPELSEKLIDAMRELDLADKEE